MALPNTAFPLLHVEADFTLGPPSLVGVNRKSLNATSLRKTAVTQIATQRGRQYELDQVQAGTCDLEVVDPAQALSPSNGTSPFMTGGNAIKPYRAMRVAAMWPAGIGTGNIINTAAASSYDPTFETTIAQWTRAGGTTTLAQSAAQAFQGTKSLAVTQSASGAGAGARALWRTAPSITYVFSAYVYPTAGTVRIQVTAASGTVYTSATASTLNTWTRLSVSWVSEDTLEPVVVYNTSSTSVFYVDAVQLEFGTTPTTFTTTGPLWYEIYNGYIERYPRHYELTGTLPIGKLTAVDALAVLSRTEVTQSYSSTVLADGPTVLIPFSDTVSITAQQPQGGTPCVGFTSLGNTSSQVQFGSDSFLDGTPALSVGQQNADPVTSGNPAYVAYAGARTATTRYGAVTFNPQSATLECWVKVTSGTAYFGAAALGAAEGFATEAAGPQYYIGWYTSAGRLIFVYNDPNGGAGTSGGISNGSTYIGYPDGQWHHLVLRFTSTNHIQSIVDGVFGGIATLSSTPSPGVGLNMFFCEATTYFSDPQTTLAIANMAVYPTALSDTQITTHYQRGIGYQAEASGARVSRLLAKYWGGSSTVDTGYVKLAPDYAYNTRMMLDILQEISETERGLLFVTAGGTVRFEDRSARYQNQTALWILGENPPGASPTEYPYEGYKDDFDPTYVFSQANLSRPGNSNFAPIVNATTQGDVGQRVLTQTLQVNTDFDLTQAGIFYTTRYATAKQRIEKLTLHPAANPALWPLALSLEISQRVTVKRRVGGIETTAPYYVEQVSHSIDANSSEWVVDVQLSPVFVPNAWVLGNATYGVLGTTTVPVF